MKTAGGWAVWALVALLAWTMPGQAWRPASIPPFPAGGLLGFLFLLGTIAVAAPLAVLYGGRGLARSRPLSLLEAPPPLLWGILLLALWPAAWGPPGTLGWGAAFLAFALPTEMRWLAQALPREHPFPDAWGASVRSLARRRAMAALLPHWLAARLPVWVLATLVLERVFGVHGLGSDWIARVGARDRPGLVLWVAALALLWRASRPRREA